MQRKSAPSSDDAADTRTALPSSCFDRPLRHGRVELWVGGTRLRHVDGRDGCGSLVGSPQLPWSVSPKLGSGAPIIAPAIPVDDLWTGAIRFDLWERRPPEWARNGPVEPGPGPVDLTVLAGERELLRAIERLEG